MMTCRLYDSSDRFGSALSIKMRAKLHEQILIGQNTPMIRRLNAGGFYSSLGFEFHAHSQANAAWRFIPQC